MLCTKLIAKLILKTEGCLYTYPGGTIAPLLHECKHSGVDLIVSKAEQGAGYMAIAHALLKGKASFVAVTSGPGATNLITCLADAYYDSVPIIAFTGQVGTNDLVRAPNLRQRGFQEVPIIEIVSPITKAVFQPKTPEELAEVLIKAYVISQSGRPGPVLIDLPMDVQMTTIDSSLLDNIKVDKAIPPIQQKGAVLSQNQVEEIISSLKSAKRPVILTGGGAQKDWKLIRILAKQFGVPVISSLRGIGIMSYKDPLYIGWIGHTGTPSANWTLANADWVLVLGSRLDVRQTGTEIQHLERKIIVHVDIDSNELNYGRFQRTFLINERVETFVEMLIKCTKTSPMPDWSNWLQSVHLKKEQMKLNDHGMAAGVRPDECLSFIDSLTQKMKTAIVTGVGSHQQWAARYFSFEMPNKLFFTSAGHGTMGYCLPVAIGINRLDRDRLVIAIDGDGSFQMNIQELALITELDLNLKIVIMDNTRLGIVSQFQKITFGDDPTTGIFLSPDFLKIAKAYGLDAFRLDKFDTSIIKDWLYSPKPAVLHVKVQHDAPLSPMLLAGQYLDNMWYYDPES